jgi:hypothetical protein
MLLQTLYFIVDLYFVAPGRCSAHRVARAASCSSFRSPQMLAWAPCDGVAWWAAEPVGRPVFGQAVGLAAACTLVTLVGGYAMQIPTWHLGADAQPPLPASFSVGSSRGWHSVRDRRDGFGCAAPGSPNRHGRAALVVVNTILADPHRRGRTRATARVQARDWRLCHAAGDAVLVVFHQARALRRVRREAASPKLPRNNLPISACPRAGIRVHQVVHGMYGVAISAPPRRRTSASARIMQMVFLRRWRSRSRRLDHGQNFGAAIRRVREAAWRDLRPSRVAGLWGWCNSRVEWFAPLPRPAVAGAANSRGIWNFVAIGIVFAAPASSRRSNTWPALGSTQSAMTFASRRWIARALVPAAPHLRSRGDCCRRRRLRRLQFGCASAQPTRSALIGSGNRGRAGLRYCG